MQWTGEEVPAGPTDLSPQDRYIYSRTRSGDLCRRSRKLVPDVDVFFYRCFFLLDSSLHRDIMGDCSESSLLDEIVTVPAEIAEIVVLVRTHERYLRTSYYKDSLIHLKSIAALEGFLVADQDQGIRSILLGYRDAQKGTPENFHSRSSSYILHYLVGWRMVSDSYPYGGCIDWALFLAGFSCVADFPTSDKFPELVHLFLNNFRWTKEIIQYVRPEALHAILETHLELTGNEVSIWAQTHGLPRLTELLPLTPAVFINRRYVQNAGIIDDSIFHGEAHLRIAAGLHVENLESTLDARHYLAGLMISVAHPQNPKLKPEWETQQHILISSVMYCPVEHAENWLDGMTPKSLMNSISTILKAQGRLEHSYFDTAFTYGRK